MKNILKISLIALLVMSLMFCIVACGGEETPAPDNGGNTDGGNTDGGNTDGGNTDGGNTDGGNTDGGDQGGEDNGDNGDQGDTPVTPDPEPGKWGEFVPIG